MLQRPNFTAQALAAEGVQPLPTPPLPQFYANPQPPPPPIPPPVGVAMQYPVTIPQLPPGFGGYGHSPHPTPPSLARQSVQNFSHSFAGSAGSAAGHAVGSAAIGALLARVGAGAAMGAEAGPAGVIGGALIGGIMGAAGDTVVHGLMNRGGTGGTTDPSPDVPGTISGFRPQGEQRRCPTTCPCFGRINGSNDR